MKHDPAYKIIAAVILTGVAVSLFAPASHAAEATTKPKHTKTRSGTYQDSNGGSGTVNSTVTQGGGERTRNTTLTNQYGQTATHAADRTWDKSTGTGTVSTSTTGFNGRSTSRQGTLTKNADGSVSGQGTLTGPKGQTSTYADNTVKTDTGRATTGTITGPKGQSSTFTNDVDHTAPGAVTRTSTLTGPKGQTTEREVSRQVNPDGSGTRVIQVTKPDGTTESRTETFQASSAPAS